MPDLPASQKLQSAQLVTELPSSPKLFEAQLDQSAPGSSSQQPQEVKRERPGRTNTRHSGDKAKVEEGEEGARTCGSSFWVLGGIWPHVKMLALRWKMLEVTGKGHQEVGLLRPTAAEPREYNHFCKHCWGKGATPGGDSEATRVEEDSGSSSTDA